MRVTPDRRFNEKQEKWLEIIKLHVADNLLLEKEDIDYLPIFTREGGSWGKLNKVLERELERVNREIKSAIAA
jgi:hypothetical protein